MASGKSLELAAISRAPADQKCICGASWSSHMRKDGKGPYARFTDAAKHQPVTANFNRKHRRQAVRR